MDCSRPGLPVHHQLLEPTQTHVHWVGNATQPSHPLSSHPFFSHLQSFPASGSFPMSQLFASGGQSTGVSASASVLPVNTQDWSPSGWTGWISLQSKGLSTVFSNTTVQKRQFLGAQLSLYKIGYLLTQCFLSLKDNVFFNLFTLQNVQVKSTSDMILIPLDGEIGLKRGNAFPRCAVNYWLFWTRIQEEWMILDFIPLPGCFKKISFPWRVTACFGHSVESSGQTN